MRCGVFFVVFLCFAACLGGASAHPTEPTTSWVYPYLYELRLRNPQDRFFANTGPYQRDDLAHYVFNLKASGERSRWLRSMLIRELAPSLQVDSTDVTVVTDLLITSCLESKEVTRASGALRLAIYSGNELSLWSLFRTSLNWGDLHKVEARAWKRNATASLDAGGLSYQHGRLSIFVGRDCLSWGIDRRRGLLFSGSAHAFDMVKMTFRTERFLYTTFASRLRRGWSEPWDRDIRRYVAGHRLEFAARPGLNLGVAEAVIYGGRDRAFELAYQNPLAILYAEQWNLREDDNILVSGDFALNLQARLEARAEIVIDDFQYDFKSEPHKIGFGIELLSLNPIAPEASLIGASYFQIKPNTYGHRIDYNRFTQEMLPIGYPDGPDCDRFNVWLSVSWQKDVLVTFDFLLRRKGEGRISDSEETNRHSDFLQGIVENDRRLGVSIVWHPSPLVLAQAKIEWHQISNLDNIEGSKQSGVEASLCLSSNVHFLGNGGDIRQ